MARKFYIENPNGYSVGQSHELSGDEFLHAIKVLRHTVGDELSIIDGFGYEYNSIIEKVNKNSFSLKILDKSPSLSETNSDVTVFQALVKGDKFELITQKLTELGVKKIVPFESEFCQVKKNTTRLDRLEKISIEALKQCGRAKKVEIDAVKTFDQVLEILSQYDVVIFAYEKASDNLSQTFFENTKNLKVAIVVGSEGGFSQSEAKKLAGLKNVKTISLGNRILRAETASIALTSVIMFCLGEWSLNE